MNPRGMGMGVSSLNCECAMAKGTTWFDAKTPFRIWHSGAYISKSGVIKIELIVENRVHIRVEILERLDGKVG